VKFHILLVELAALALFFLALLESRKRGSPRLLEFVMIFFYGLLLEELDQRIFKTYHYSPDFLLTIGQVPLSIAWLWAVILASSMAISDATGMPTVFRPFFDALLAVWMDLSLDAIAIRMGFWNWIIPLNEGWFGVPAGNLYAWMWVAFLYSAWARGVRRLAEKNQKWKWAYLGIPFLAYAGLYGAMVSIGFVGKMLDFTTQGERLYLFWGQFLVFVGIVLIAWRRPRATREPVARLWWASRLAIHLYFLLAFFLFGFYRTAPILGLIALGVLGGEGILSRLVRGDKLRVAPT